jgi:hypothetical protein
MKKERTNQFLLITKQDVIFSKNCSYYKSMLNYILVPHAFNPTRKWLFVSTGYHGGTYDNKGQVLSKAS